MSVGKLLSQRSRYWFGLTLAAYLTLNLALKIYSMFGDKAAFTFSVNRELCTTE